MRTVTTVTNVYSLEELKEANPDGYTRAIEGLARAEQDDFFNYYFSDYQATLDAIEKLFDVKRAEWETDGYSSYYYVKDMTGDEIDTFKRTYSYVVNTIVPQLKDFDCCLTGFCADYVALQVLQDFLKGKQIFKSVTELVNAMCEAVLQDANDDYQSIGDDARELEELADANEYEYTIDGTQF